MEGESLSLGTGSGQVVLDTSASGGRELELWGADRGLADVTTDDAAHLQVRARRGRCAGDPRLTVMIDRRPALDRPLTSTAWQTFSAPVRLGDGRHRIAVASSPGAGGDCRQSLLVDWIRLAPAPGATGRRPATPSTGVPNRPARLLFAAHFAREGIGQYPFQIHPWRIKVVDDPVLGARRKVLRFHVFQRDTGPTQNPRAQIETPCDFRVGQDRFFGFSYLFPKDFPTRLPDRAWVTLGEQAYNPLHGGAGGTSLRVQNVLGGGPAELRWQRNATYGWDIPWHGPRISAVRGRWVDFVQRIKLSPNPRVGFVELWMNTGSGWRRQLLFGRPRLYMNTYDAVNGGGANNSRLSLYYRADIPGPLTLYHGDHRIASAGRGAFRLVAPHSYD